MEDILDSNNQSNVYENIAGDIKQTLEKMGVEANVSIEQTINGYVFNISSPDSSLLIGQKGNNLQSLQILSQVMALKKYGLMERFSIDVDDYKKKREWYLRETAKKALEHVKRTGRPVALEAMPAYERRIVHAYISQDYDIDAESTGVEPNRKIVIRPKKRGEI